MAHEIDETTGKAAFTWLQGTATPWHDLGQPTPPNSPLETWQENGGLNFHVEKKTLGFQLGDDSTASFEVIPDMSALVRTDTKAPLSVQSKARYHVHQPSEILQFFDKFIKENKLTMETCGALRGGRVVFALARMDDKYNISVGGDIIAPYFLLGTSFDGSLATHGIPTSVRVVCANTHGAALNGAGDRMFRQKHTSIFDSAALQAALDSSEGEIATRAIVFNQLADRAMTAEEVNEYFIKDVLDINPEDLSKQDKEGKELISTKTRNLITLLQTSYTKAPGANMAKGTAWGAYNAVTHFVDHAARTRDNNGDGTNLARLSSAWYGAGAATKKAALERLMKRCNIAVAA